MGSESGIFSHVDRKYTWVIRLYKTCFELLDISYISHLLWLTATPHAVSALLSKIFPSIEFSKLIAILSRHSKQVRKKMLDSHRELLELSRGEMEYTEIVIRCPCGSVCVFTLDADV